MSLKTFKTGQMTHRPCFDLRVPQQGTDQGQRGPGPAGLTDGLHVSGQVSGAGGRVFSAPAALYKVIGPTGGKTVRAAWVSGHTP